MSESLGIRLWNGTTVPTPGIFEIDAQHTTVGFVARHLMVTQVRGRFEDVEATIHVAEDPLRSVATATIGTASITTGAEERDAHLRSADFLDVENFPTMTFVSRQVLGGEAGAKWTVVNGTMRRRKRATDALRVLGDLAIRGVSRPIELELSLDGVTHDPWGGERLALSARGQIDRESYGMTWNVALEAGGWLVSQKIDLEIRAQAIRQA
jgi:polyisoprenoid-binding protein YceI